MSAADDALMELHGKADAILKLQVQNADRLAALEGEPSGQKVTERRPLSEIQADLRAETDKRARKAGRQM